jgi:hypothetical protein
MRDGRWEMRDEMSDDREVRQGNYPSTKHGAQDHFPSLLNHFEHAFAGPLYNFKLKDERK